MVDILLVHSHTYKTEIMQALFLEFVRAFCNGPSPPRGKQQRYNLASRP